jgi:hypothetical protein
MLINFFPSNPKPINGQVNGRVYGWPYYFRAGLRFYYLAPPSPDQTIILSKLNAGPEHHFNGVAFRDVQQELDSRTLLLDIAIAFLSSLGAVVFWEWACRFEESCNSSLRIRATIMTMRVGTPLISLDFCPPLPEPVGNGYIDGHAYGWPYYFQTSYQHADVDTGHRSFHSHIDCRCSFMCNCHAKPQPLGSHLCSIALQAGIWISTVVLYLPRHTSLISRFIGGAQPFRVRCHFVDDFLQFFLQFVANAHPCKPQFVPK